ncbi:50S ribosomal protein L1 [Phaffia rhodozyma]|uniref:50S ribosomal protein L1 n=1 Tax=Phaffia rhodozyma TaxID=264483 RepID=A0A0F7SEI2_PHARH|nr:50S ribosomal protein L1 [Phaffia rhodozyma]
MSAIFRCAANARLPVSSFRASSMNVVNSSIVRNFSMSSVRDASKKKAKIVFSEDSMSLEEAFNTLKSWEVGRPWSGIDVQLSVELDKKKPSMRGRLNFPRDPSTKPPVLLMFCEPHQVQEALDAGATYAGGVELFSKLLDGEIPIPSQAFSTARFHHNIMTDKTLVRFLGTKGILPAEKRGTVVNDVTTAISNNLGALDWKVSKTGDVAAAIARPDWQYPDVEANVLAFLEAVRRSGMSGGASFDISSPKLTVVTKMYLHSTQGPGIEINDILLRSR